MILAGGCAALFDLASNGIHTVGAVPRGLPEPTLPSLTGIDIVSLLPTALRVALAGTNRSAAVLVVLRLALVVTGFASLVVLGGGTVLWLIKGELR